jgi:hypothetical protein
MFLKIIFTLIVVISSLAYPVLASELSDPVELPEARPEELQFIETRLADMPVDMPIFPGSEEVAANITKQGGFEIRTQVFQVASPYKTVVDYYKKRLGKQVDFVNQDSVEGKDITHLSITSGSKSKNILIEDAGDELVRFTFTSFQGGGGYPTQQG